MKKRISVLLAALMVVTTLGACNTAGDGDKGTDGTKAPVDVKKVKDKSEPEKVDIDPLTIRGADGTDENMQEVVMNSLNDEYLVNDEIPSNYAAYPWKEDVTLDVWMPVNPFLTSLGGDLNTLANYQIAQKLTGIKVNFISPAAGTEADAFTIMTSSPESLPDIVVEADRYPGGLEAGMKDGAYIDLTDKLAKHAPNYAILREGNEDRRRTTVTDNGEVIGFSGLSPYQEWQWFGILIKKEALEKTGMDVPKTIADWDAFLAKCQEVGYSEPLNYGSGYGQIFTDAFNGAYGVYDWWFVDKDKKVNWGPMQEGAKDYLKMMRDWNAKGYFNPDWTSADFNARMAHASSDKAAVILDSPDTMWGVWRQDNGIEFVGAPNPVLNEGDTPTTTWKSWSNTGSPAAITTNCDNVEAAMAWLDFGFTKKGWELFNFGEYGKTHLINEEGMPYYHDESVMFNDPDGHPMSQLIWKYRIHNGPNIRDEHNSNPLIANKESYSGDIRKMWTETHDNSYAFPPVSYTREERDREIHLGGQLGTLRGEYFAKIILGELPLEAYDEFLEKAKEIGLEEWLDLLQKVADRYYER